MTFRHADATRPTPAERPSSPQWLRTAHRLAGAYYRLAVADLALARAAGVRAAAAGACAVVFGSVAWLGVCVSTGVWLLYSGMALVWAMLIPVVLSAVLGVVSLRQMLRLLTVADLAETRRSLDELFADGLSAPERTDAHASD